MGLFRYKPYEIRLQYDDLHLLLRLIKDNYTGML
jgi:hypothetical protein